MQHQHAHKVTGRVQGAPGLGHGAGVGMMHGTETMLGMGVMRHSPATLKKKSRSRKLVESAMREVHTDTPSTVERADVAGAKKEKMLRAIAYSKARKAGAKLPQKTR